MVVDRFNIRRAGEPPADIRAVKGTDLLSFKVGHWENHMDLKTMELSGLGDLEHPPKSVVRAGSFVNNGVVGDEEAFK